MCGAFSGRATSTAAVGVVHDSFISYSDGRRHRWSHNPFCVNRHDIFQNSTAEQRQFNETPSQRHVFCGKRHDPRCFGLVADATTEMRVPASYEIPTKSTTRATAKRTRRAKGAWTARRDMPSDARRMRLLRVGRRGMYAHLTRGNGHVSREGRRDNRSILRVSGEQLEAACERTHETAAPPRTNGDSARTASTAPSHPKKIKTLKRST